LTHLFRSMFAHSDVLLRGAMSVGDFYLVEEKSRSILLGSPMFEVANLYEAANWIGMITTPSATLTLDQLNSFKQSTGKLDDSNIHDDVKQILKDFYKILYIVDVASTYFIKYDVSLKTPIENDCYVLGWPFTNGPDLNQIEHKLNDFLDFNKFQTKNIHHGLYVKYRNTQIFYNFIQNEKHFIKINDQVSKTIRKISKK
jgi:hypothetical protein